VLKTLSLNQILSKNLENYVKINLQQRFVENLWNFLWI